MTKRPLLVNVSPHGEPNEIVESCAICDIKTYRTDDIIEASMANTDGKRFLKGAMKIEPDLKPIPVCTNCGLQIWASVNHAMGKGRDLNINNR